MRVQYITSACVLVECGGVRVLCDPWLTDGIYYGSWYHYPPLKSTPEDFADVDYIFISHIHPDHLDAETLKRLPKTIPVVILEYEERFVYKLLKGLGFDRIFEVPHAGVFPFSDHFSARLYAADNCDPAVCGSYFQCHIGTVYTKTLQIDSMVVFLGDGQVVVNTNDCPYELGAATARRIAEEYPTIDFQFVGYSGAAAYPQCFDNLDDQAKLEEASKHRAFKLNDAVKYLQIFKPKAFMPFAGLYLLGGKLAPLNRYTSPPKWEELPAIFAEVLEKNQMPFRLVLLNEGEWFDLETFAASAPFEPPAKEEREDYIHRVLSAKKLAYEDDPLPQGSLLEKIRIAQKKMAAHEKFYGEVDNGTRLYIDAQEAGFFYIPQGSQEEVVELAPHAVQAPYLIVHVDPRLLVRILDKKAHWNNAEVGSHLRFTRDPNVYQRSIHLFMSYLHC